MELSPSNIVTGVLSELRPQEEVAKSKSSDREAPGDAPTEVLEKNIKDGQPVDERA